MSYFIGVILKGIFFLFFNYSSVIGASYFMISDVGTSAESLGIGQINGFSESATILFENPAGLYRINNASISLFRTTFMQRVDYQSLAISAKLLKGHVGVGYMDANIYGLHETGVNSSGWFYEKGTFDYKNYLFFLSYQYSFKPWLSIGTSLVRYSNEFYDVDGKGWNFDLGAIFLRNRYEGSLVFKNVFFSKKMSDFFPIVDSTVNYNDNRFEILPLQIQFSSKYQLDNYYFSNRYFKTSDLFVYNALTVIRKGSDNSHLLNAFGVKYIPSFTPFLTLSLGLKQELIPDLNSGKDSIASSKVIGIGCHLDNFHIYFAYENTDDSKKHYKFDNKTYISLRLDV